MGESCAPRLLGWVAGQFSELEMIFVGEHYRRLGGNYVKCGRWGKGLSSGFTSLFDIKDI